MTDSDNALGYDDAMTALLVGVWGEGYMSPGGDREVARVVDGLSLEGKRLLDIGSGLGGNSLYLASQGASEVVGIDVEADLKPKADDLARKRGLTERCTFMTVEPGPLPFEDGSFDIVFSKDSIIHIADKHALCHDIHRVLRPGGTFAASDWLSGYEGEPSPDMATYIEAEGLGFELASPAVYEQALNEAGFVNVSIEDHNDWYREEARRERSVLADDLYASLVAEVGAEFVDHEIGVWDKMIVVLDQGQLRPTLMRGHKAN